MTTSTELLDATNAAILVCLTAQSYTAFGRAKNLAKLSDLQAFRQSLLDEIDVDADSGSMVSLVSVERPTG